MVSNKSKLFPMLLITAISIYLFTPFTGAIAKEAKDKETQMKVIFYTLDKKTQTKGEFLGYAQLREGKLDIKVTDPKLEKLLKSDFFTTGGKTEELTLSNGKKVLRGGMVVYQSGTSEHLKAIAEKSAEFGYIAEIVAKEIESPD